MEAYPKFYYESKKRTLFLSSFLLIPYLGVSLYYTYLHALDLIYAVSFLKGLIAVFILFFLFLYFYPAATLQIFQDHFVYKKGKYDLSAKWSEVKAISFQLSAASTPSVLPSALLIFTEKGTTKLIETKTLRRKDARNSKINLIEFVRELGALSGKKVLLRGMITGQFSKASFEDYAKGLGLIS